jgi:CheY-like chemotaxis protein
VADVREQQTTTRTPLLPRHPPPRNRWGRDLVLVVGDAAVADATVMLLDVLGFEALEGQRSGEATRAADGRMPALILCDSSMSENGTAVEVIRSIRARTLLPIRAVILCDDPTPPIAETLHAVSHCRVVARPVNGDELAALITGMLCRGPEAEHM